jgi:hypothetical protein
MRYSCLTKSFRFKLHLGNAISCARVRGFYSCAPHDDLAYVLMQQTWRRWSATELHSLLVELGYHEAASAVVGNEYSGHDLWRMHESGSWTQLSLSRLQVSACCLSSRAARL